MNITKKIKRVCNSFIISSKNGQDYVQTYAMKEIFHGGKPFKTILQKYSKLRDNQTFFCSQNGALRAAIQLDCKVLFCIDFICIIATLKTTIKC